MRQRLKTILQALTCSHGADLRFTDQPGSETVSVRIAFSTGNSIYCMPDQPVEKGKKISHKAYLVQKSSNDYFFLSGYVSGSAPNLLLVAVESARWFVKVRRGHITWFRERQVFEKS